jgi:hypothetical protein
MVYVHLGKEVHLSDLEEVVRQETGKPIASTIEWVPKPSSLNQSFHTGLPKGHAIFLSCCRSRKRDDRVTSLSFRRVAVSARFRSEIVLLVFVSNAVVEMDSPKQKSSPSLSISCPWSSSSILFCTVLFCSTEPVTTVRIGNGCGNGREGAPGKRVKQKPA